MSIPKKLKKHRKSRNSILITSLIIFMIYFISKQILWLAASFALINIYAFILMGIDKRSSKKGDSFRIPEKTLLLLGYLFGSLGISMGMSIFRHKTEHTAFKVIPFLLPIHGMIITYLYLVDISILH